jgi:hypothetical protein
MAGVSETRLAAGDSERLKDRANGQRPPIFGGGQSSGSDIVGFAQTAPFGRADLLKPNPLQ